MTKIHKSNDYNKFKFFEYNRDIDEGHVIALMLAIEQRNQLDKNPLLVTEDFYIIDGQHRLEAAKRLGVEFYYMIEENFSPDQLAQLNRLQKNWVTADYLKFWSTQGNENYRKLQEYIKKYEIPLTCLTLWLQGSGGRTSRVFRTGQFVFKEGMEPYIEYYKRYVEIIERKRFTKWKQIVSLGAFHRAFKGFITNPLIDPETFIAQAEKCPYELINFGSFERFYNYFVEIYNFSRRKERLQFVQGRSPTIVPMGSI